MIIPMLCVTIFVILVVWFLLPRVARLMIHTPTAIRDRKSGSAGMPRPISYAVFCLKKKKGIAPPIWRRGQILLNESTWTSAVQEGVQCHLDTVERYWL